jgi:hypothetical protein
MVLFLIPHFNVEFGIRNEKIKDPGSGMKNLRIRDPE